MARSEISKENFFDNQIAMQSDTRKNNQRVSKSSTGYLSQENVKEFNKEMQKKVFSSSRVGTSRVFKDPETTINQIQEYFDLCSDKQVVPTITSLALWLGCDRDTIYYHANNPNSQYFGMMKNCVSYLHSIMQNGTVDGKINPVTYIFISKNDYGMRDDKNITVNAGTNQSPVNNQETMNAIQKQLEEENITNAEFEER